MNPDKNHRKKLAEIGTRIRHHLRTELNIVRKTISLGRLVFSLGYYDNNSNYKKVLLFLTVKTFKSLRALKVLCQKGYGQDAKSILRGMTDSLITIAYIQTDKDILSTRFIEYGWIDKYRILKAIKASKVWPDLISGKKEKLSKEGDILQGTSGFIEKYGYKKPPSHWSGFTTAQIAMKAGNMPEDIYNWVFRFTSLAVHPSAAQADEYILGLADANNVRVEYGPSPQWTKTALVMGCIVFLWILGQYDEGFGLGQETQIEKLMKKLNKKYKQKENNG